MVYVFFATGFEEVEALTVVDILRRGKIDVSMVSMEDSLEVVSSHKVTVVCDAFFCDIKDKKAEMLVCPGGMPGTLNLKAHEGLRSLLMIQYENGDYIAAICAAPTIFGSMGLLNGKNAVCYPGMEDQLTGAFTSEQKVVQDGNIITSRGLGTAIEFGAKLVSLLRDEEEAKRILASVVY